MNCRRYEAVSGGPLCSYLDVRAPELPIEIDRKTRVVLVNPDPNRKHAAKFVLSPYHGTQRLKHFLEESRGINTAVIDFNINDKDKFFALLRKYQPPVIGCAILYETLEQDLQNIWEIRKACPNSLVVVGGIEATMNSDEYIKKLPIDALLLGEGEYPLADLVKKTEANIEANSGIIDKDALAEECRDISGWVFKKTDGSIVKTGPAKVMTEEQYRDVFRSFNFGPRNYQPYWQFTIDNYPPELLEIMDINPKTVRVITSNYCPNNCTFCVSTKFLKTASGEKTVEVRMIAAEDMVDKVEQYLAEEPDALIYLDDENALINKKRMRRFCELIIEGKIKGNFACRARPSDIKPELCALMKKAEFRVISIGIEAYDEGVLRNFNKKITGEISDRAIKIIQDSGMRCSFNLILFAPTISKPGLLKTVDKAVEYIGKNAYVGITPYIVPYPGTLYHHNPEYEAIGGELVVPGTGEVIDYPETILPQDPEVRKVAENALRDGEAVTEEWKKRFGWKYSIMPREVSDLALFYCIYREFGLLEENKDKIEPLVERILKNKGLSFVRADLAMKGTIREEVSVTTEDYNIIIPVYNEGGVLEGVLRYIERKGYLDKVVFIDDKSSDNTVDILGKWERKKGLKVYYMAENGKKVGSIREVVRDLHAKGRLEKHVILVDTDCLISSRNSDSVTTNLQRTIAYMDERGFHAMTLKLVPVVHKNGTFFQRAITNLQYLEYLTARTLHRFLAKKSKAIVIPGSSRIFKSDALLDVLNSNPAWDYETEDIDITINAQEKGYKLGYCGEFLDVNTDAPDNLKEFLHQRSMWSRALLKTFSRQPVFFVKEILGFNRLGFISAVVFSFTITTIALPILIILFGPSLIIGISSLALCIAIPVLLTLVNTEHTTADLKKIAMFGFLMPLYCTHYTVTMYLAMGTLVKRALYRSLGKDIYKISPTPRIAGTNVTSLISESEPETRKEEVKEEIAALRGQIRDLIRMS